jgi:hypothetical protein
MDAGHAGWLGWPANLSPAAQLFTQVWTTAGKSPFIRGLATDVSNYNALVASSPDPITQGNPNYDEMLYVNVRTCFYQSVASIVTYGMYTYRRSHPCSARTAGMLSLSLTKVALDSRTCGTLGVTGVTSRVLDLVCVRQPTLARSTSTALSGLSLVVSAMVQATLPYVFSSMSSPALQSMLI